MLEESQQQPSQTSKEPTQEETLEFLKREEVRTMAKDVAKEREKEATKERERIAGLKKEIDQKKPEIVLSQQSSEHKEVKQEQLKQLLTLKRSLRPSEKLFIRLVIGGTILFFIFNTVAFGFWYFFQRQVEIIQEPEDVIEEQVETPVIPAVLEPEPEISTSVSVPIAFFEIPQQELLLENSKELLKELEVFLSTPPTLLFLNIIVKTQLGILSTEEFLDGATIIMPLSLKEKLTENTMLFSYYKDNKKRLGIIFELKDVQEASEQLQLWEQTLEQDTSAFFSIIGKKGSAYSPLFRSLTYQGVPVRFQTFSVIDFGIVYGIINNKLILTSSLESFQRTIDKLKEKI